VGVKTAAKWLNTFGSLEELLSRANEVNGKVGEALRANLDQARLARQLVAFKSDLSLGLTWNALRFDPANAAA
jgi:DNA polymerase-1